MRVLVTGGAGYIGSVVVEALRASGHAPIVYDNLAKGHAGALEPGVPLVHADLTDRASLLLALGRGPVEGVIHLAASSLVGESVRDPGAYYRNNVSAGIVLLDALVERGVRRFVFSSTAAVYGEPEKQPIVESDALHPTNPYGESKLAFERALEWYGRAHGLRYAALRYFNAAGATEQHGEWHDPETHLIPIVLQAAAGTRERVDVYGDDYPTRDGTCVRDYIHVADLARAHILALEALDLGNAIYNLGCGGRGYTVREVIGAAREITGRDIPVAVQARRPGDPAVLVASSAKIRAELGWEPQFPDLPSIIASAWRWLQSHPRGYSS